MGLKLIIAKIYSFLHTLCKNFNILNFNIKSSKRDSNITVKNLKSNINSPDLHYLLPLFKGNPLSNVLNYRQYSTHLNKELLDPWYVTGFTDAEGSFNVVIAKNSNLKIGWRVQVRFIIELHIKDITLLKSIKSFFNNVGTITVDENRNVARYSVVDLNSLVKIIVPQFLNYPLQSSKSINFYYWKKCVEHMVNNQHLNYEGLNKIVSLKGAINNKLCIELKTAFPNHTPIINSDNIDLKLEGQLNPYWITGFIEGDGSFYVISKSTKSDFIMATSVTMSIGLDIKEEPLILRIKSFFSLGFGSIGNVYSYKSKGAVEFKITKLKDINNIINMHFTKYPLVGFKAYNFDIWKNIVELVNKKEHFTKEGIIKINNLKMKLNLWS